MSSIEALAKRSLAVASLFVSRRNGDLSIEHQPQPFVDAKVVSMSLLDKLAIGGRHPGKTKRIHLIQCWMCQHLMSSSLVVGFAANIAVRRRRLHSLAHGRSLIETRSENVGDRRIAQCVDDQRSLASQF